MNESGASHKRFRIWPGAVFPAGLTLLLALAGWQFVMSVTAERERRNDADAALSAYARMEAGELARRAAAAAETFVAGRLASRAEQEQNLRFEIRGVMEAVTRVLSASLERGRRAAPALRDVPGFPSGFAGLGRYLRFSRPPGGGGDAAAAALRASAPELGGLLPAGCSLAVVENSAVEIFSLGGGAPPAGALSVEMGREFALPAGAEEEGGGREAGRRWTLLLKLHAPDRHPVPGAAEIAARLTEEMGGAALNGAVWRGWLLAADGRPAAVFPAGPRAGEAAAPAAAAVPGMSAPALGVPPSPLSSPQFPGILLPPVFTGRPGEWTESAGDTLVWLEAAPRAAEREFAPAVAVAIARPLPSPDLAEEFFGDTRWMCTLGALTLGALGFWVWFVRNASASRRASARLAARAAAPSAAKASAPAARASAGAEAAAAEILRRRLVRAETARAVADAEGVIVADIAANGGMTVTGAPGITEAIRPSAEARRAPPSLPSGSLFRLQARHRGGKGRPGSRALDGTANPVLRTLAARIRPAAPSAAGAGSPVAPARTEARPQGRATERYVR